MLRFWNKFMSQNVYFFILFNCLMTQAYSAESKELLKKSNAVKLQDKSKDQSKYDSKDQKPVSHYYQESFGCLIAEEILNEEADRKPLGGILFTQDAKIK